MPFDNVIVSTDESYFIQYIPIVARAWKKFFPAVKLHIAFVTDRNENDSLVSRMKQHGIVHLFKPIDGINKGNHGKIARHVLASRFGEVVCMIEDIDTIPLQREFYFDRTNRREKDHLLLVGKEVFDTDGECCGQVPMSTITAEGRVFKEVLNPDNLNDEALIKHWIGQRGMYEGFSDETLVRELLKAWKAPRINHVERGVDIHKDWVDRSWWRIDEEKLFAGKYVTCNFLRPFAGNFLRIEPIIRYIYDGFPSEDEVILV